MLYEFILVQEENLVNIIDNTQNVVSKILSCYALNIPRFASIDY